VDYIQECFVAEGYDLEGFSERVKERRSSLGMSQEQFAVKAGVASSAVWRWENGTLPRDVSALAQIASVLDVSVGWLLGEQKGQDYREGAKAAISWMRLTLDEIEDQARTNPTAFLDELGVAGGEGVSWHRQPEAGTGKSVPKGSLPSGRKKRATTKDEEEGRKGA
jgi:transcriptional regulator with XRE-family HTH domain